MTWLRSWIHANNPTMLGQSLVDRIQEARTKVFFVCILAIGLLFRLIDIRQPFIGDYTWNEVHYALIARNFSEHSLLEQYTEVGLEYTNSPLLPWMIYASFRVFGEHEWAARLPTFALGVLSLCLLFLVGRELYDDRIALLAMLVAATAPGVVFFSWNIQPDGPMAAFSLLALLTLIYFQRKKRWRWFLASLASLTLGVLAKYTAILIYPVLLKIWFDGLESKRISSKWLSMLLYFSVPLVPVLAWIVWGKVHASHPDVLVSFASYVNRSGEWQIAAWKEALLTIWPNLSRQMGSMLWYSMAVVSPYFLCLSPINTIRRHITLILLICPWLLQLIYPRAWTANEYYTYLALYGLSILFALMLSKLWDSGQRFLSLSKRMSTTVVGLTLCMLAASNLWDYRVTYHRSFYPWCIVSQPEPFYSAKVVNSLNNGHEFVLADVKQAAYYVGGDFKRTRRWWGASDDKVVEAIESGRFKYIVVTYRPSIEILNAIRENDYKQIAPAAWEKAADP